MQYTLPEPILNVFAQRMQLVQDELTIVSLSSNNPVFRVKHPNRGGWILKKSSSPAKEIEVSRLFQSCAIPMQRILPVQGNWIQIDDLGLLTVQMLLDADGGDLADLFTALGRGAVDAYLAGMRDRNLRNMLFDTAAPSITLIDYDSAFAVRYLDRLLRPSRLLGYLIRRMLFDVHFEVKGSAGLPEHIISAFCMGALQECQRLLSIREHLKKDNMTLRARFFLTTGIRHTHFWQHSLKRLVKKTQKEYIHDSQR